MSTVQPFRPNLPSDIGHLPPQLRRHWRDDLRIWWREIDKVLLILIALLMAIGTAAVAAASPASADRLSTSDVQLSDFHFFKRHLAWQALGILTMLGASMISRESARRLGILLAGAMLFFLFLVPIVGVEVNGSRRWLRLGMQFQPSEFLKPGFAILMAWILSWRLRDPNLPVAHLSFAIMLLVGCLLMMQPNFGAALLFGGVWFALLILSGTAVKWLGAMMGGAATAIIATYFLYDNARNRIDSFLSGGSAFDHVDLAERTLLAGGWTGSGLWLGVRKMNLPEAHTDYIFSVIGEEFGLIVCLAVIVLYLGVIWRVLMRLVDDENLFTLLAGAGLITQIGGQAMINILVNLQLFPSKGMTLPLVSYGGSSTIAVCLTFGLLLSITRRNPFLDRETQGLFELMGQKKEA